MKKYESSKHSFTVHLDTLIHTIWLFSKFSTIINIDKTKFLFKNVETNAFLYSSYNKTNKKIIGNNGVKNGEK